jgi:hypothetical protein
MLSLSGCPFVITGLRVPLVVVHCGYALFTPEVGKGADGGRMNVAVGEEPTSRQDSA